MSITLGTRSMSTAIDQTVARTPGYYTNSPPALNTQTYTQIDGSKDRPFWGMGAPHEANSTQYPNDPLYVAPTTPRPYAGIDATLLRKFNNAPSVKRPAVFDAESQFDSAGGANPLSAVQHPLLEKQMLAKVFEHFTTRSNVFAVYMTVGYFEVIDDTQKPELLGDEIGVIRDGNSNSTTFGQVVETKAVRHRMFAIVDRTNLALQPAKVTSATVITDEDKLRQGPAPFYYTVPVEQLSQQQWKIRGIPYASLNGVGGQLMVTGSYNGISWTMSPFIAGGGSTPSVPGTVLYLGVGKEQRRLSVLSVVPPNSATTVPGTIDVIVGLPTGATIGDVPTGWSVKSGWSPVINTTTGNFDPPGGSVLITNGLPGNPGPQPDFDPQNPRYRGVVIYSTVLK